MAYIHPSATAKYMLDKLNGQAPPLKPNNDVPIMRYFNLCWQNHQQSLQYEKQADIERAYVFCKRSAIAFIQGAMKHNSYRERRFEHEIKEYKSIAETDLKRAEKFRDLILMKYDKDDELEEENDNPETEQKEDELQQRLKSMQLATPANATPPIYTPTTAAPTPAPVTTSPPTARNDVDSIPAAATAAAIAAVPAATIPLASAPSAPPAVAPSAPPPEDLASSSAPASLSSSVSSSAPLSSSSPSLPVYIPPSAGSASSTPSLAAATNFIPSSAAVAASNAARISASTAVLGSAAAAASVVSGSGYPSFRPSSASTNTVIPVAKPAVRRVKRNLQVPSVDELRPIRVPRALPEAFLKYAHNNTIRGVETCGILGGVVRGNWLVVTTCILPKQNCTANTCATTDENQLIEIQTQKDLLTLGWIHTHPTQTCFLSSVDLHTHCSYQIMLPEAIAIVMAPTAKPDRGTFHITVPGIDALSNCPRSGFHQHEEKVPLYGHATHVQWSDQDRIEFIDVRNAP